MPAEYGYDPEGIELYGMDEPEGGDYMPDELYTDDGETIDAPKSWVEETLDALGKPFPRSAIKQRAGGGGMMLDYVDGATVIRRLNQAAKQWDFQILREWQEGDLIKAHGKLTIPGIGSREHIGVQVHSNRPGSEDMNTKGAVTDCLKKCSVLFGVGLELYGPDLEALAAQSLPTQAAYGVVASIPGTQQQPPQVHQTYTPSNSPRGPVTTLTAPQNAPQLPPMPAGYNGPSEKQLAWILGLEKNFEEGELQYHYDLEGIDRMNLTGGRGGTASRVIDLLNKLKNDRQQVEAEHGKVPY